MIIKHQAGRIFFVIQPIWKALFLKLSVYQLGKSNCNKEAFSTFTLTAQFEMCCSALEDPTSSWFLWLYTTPALSNTFTPGLEISPIARASLRLVWEPHRHVFSFESFCFQDFGLGSIPLNMFRLTNHVSLLKDFLRSRWNNIAANKIQFLSVSLINFRISAKKWNIPLDHFRHFLSCFCVLWLPWNMTSK